MPKPRISRLTSPLATLSSTAFRGGLNQESQNMKTPEVSSLAIILVIGNALTSSAFAGTRAHAGVRSHAKAANRVPRASAETPATPAAPVTFHRVTFGQGTITY